MGRAGRRTQASRCMSSPSFEARRDIGRPGDGPSAAGCPTPSLSCIPSPTRWGARPHRARDTTRVLLDALHRIFP